MNSKLRMAGALVTALTLTACDDEPTGSNGGPREHGVVVNSVSSTLSVFAVADPDEVHTIALHPEGTATTLAIRDGIALVPLGLVSAVAVVDLEAEAVIDEIPLPAGSGATGVAFVNDTLAFVANPSLNSVTPVYYRAGTTGAAIPVGVYPTGLVALGNRVFVIEASIAFEGIDVIYGASSVSVIDATTLEVDTSFTLDGFNAAEGATTGDALFVVNAGKFGEDNASLSVVELPATEETEAFPGFGTFASEVEAVIDGTALVSSPVYGVAWFDPESGAFLVPPGEGFGAADANVLGIGLDANVRLWVLDAGDCASPGRALLVSGPAGIVVDEADVEVCPDAIAFGIF